MASFLAAQEIDKVDDADEADDDDNFEDYLDDDKLPLGKQILIMSMRLCVNLVKQALGMLKIIFVATSIMILSALGKKVIDSWGEVQKAAIRTLQRLAAAVIDVASFAFKELWLALMSRIRSSSATQKKSASGPAHGRGHCATDRSRQC